MPAGRRFRAPDRGWRVLQLIADEGVASVKPQWEPDELIDTWTLAGSDWDLIANKAGVTRLAFAVLLKFYEIEGRFPVYPEEVPPAAVGISRRW